MKFVAVLLSVCILFLATTEMIKPAEPSVQKMCCHKMAGMSVLQKKKNQDGHNKGCENQGCTLLFSCTLCGFIVIEPIKFQPHFAIHTEKPVSLYKIGDLSAYHPSDWKPPKAC
jgi:hypothetical protein